jgi:hypothetical protein
VVWRGQVSDQFPVPVDQKYANGEVGGSYVTGKWSNQSHLVLESSEGAKDFIIYAVLWPERGTKAARVSARLGEDGWAEIERPDGKKDRIVLSDNKLVIN